MKRLFVGVFLFLHGALAVAKPIEIVFWHSFPGYLGHELKQLVNGFNASQQEYVVKPVYKGDYIDSFTSYAAAFRAKQPPALIQIFEVGTASMLLPKGIIKPAETIMLENQQSLPMDSFLPAIRAFYSYQGRLQALPFNTSIPVIFYNAALLQEIGYNQRNFPTTWQEMEVLVKRLKEHGSKCAYSTAYPSWIQIESFSAIHGLPLVDGKTQQAVYNKAAIVNHLTRLRRWQQQHYFQYGGRTSDATVLFTSGRCALFSQSSGSYNSLTAMVTFPVGMALMPLDTDVSKQRYPNVAGGAALWATSGQSSEVYRGIARFYRYLTEASTQKAWHHSTGYIPIGLEGIYRDLAEQSTHPILKLALTDLSEPVAGKRYYHLGPQNQVRAINDEAMEAIFAGIKTPQQAMDDAILRANYTILRFSRNTAVVR